MTTTSGTLQASPTDLTAESVADIFAAWLAGFAAALESESASDLEKLFIDGVTWRDFMAFPWDFHHTLDRDATVSRLLELVKTWDARGFAPSAEHAQPGLWFATGFIRMVSHYSKFTALLIKAIEVGIESVDPDASR